ncbi:hypothetical protein BD626DRAFT_446511 [Schizophyllum amplum]|uniref:Uncharacterized protein n=1 Tax=Schizophyllum amplum TaxID=97359 RepID=A0A550CVW7_9AGAR|nr:hypothetical protein BD626DRAFT_446511 [Auriculariopsis ampla]
MARFSFVFASLALALCANATPTPEPSFVGVPREASRLAFDQLSRRVLAYDARGTYLGVVERDAAPERRDGGACSALSADDAKKLPGWDTLEQQAKDNWGDGSWKIVTNDEDFPEQPAQVCAEDAGDITIDGDPECTTQTQTLDTDISGTNGTATVSQTTGTKYTSQQTVSQESAISVGETVDVKIGIPEVADVTSSTSLSTMITNTLSNSESSESNQQTTQTVAIAVPKDGKCGVKFDVKTCTTKGSGQVPFVAQGWVWFEYDDKTKDHYKWALKIEEILSNKDDRSTYLKFDSVVDTTTNGEYKADC